MTTNNGSCPGDIDTLLVTFTTFDAQIIPDLNHISCFGENDGNITLNVNGGYPIDSYQWSNAVNGPINENLEPGIYDVLITDENGCSETFSYEINEPSPLILLDTTFSVFPSGHNISCYGANDGLINLTISDRGTILNGVMVRRLKTFLV